MNKQPQPGQYWQTQDGKLRVYVHGVTKLGTVLVEISSGQWVDFDVNQMLADWQHLPDCDSFDWQPVQYPRYFETHNREDYAFLRQDSATDFVLVRYNGTGDEVTVVTLANRAGLTEAEAMSRIVPVKPVESPDDWVTQDRVPARPGIDERAYQYEGDSWVLRGWADAANIAWPEMPRHGTVRGPATVHLRCRRKDLPAPTPATRTITFCEYVVWDEPGCERLVWALESDDLLYRHSYSTGQTRTVEIAE
jgi:hypothetical protein